jgi:hypothetical protein
MSRFPVPSPATAIAMVALFVALGGTGYAVFSRSIPDKQGVFHGCANRKSGALRLVDSAAKCKKKKGKRPGELAVQWSQRGPQGAPGAAGAAGAAGTNGTNGHDGTTVVLRPRSTSEVTTTSSVQSVPLSANSWTQPAGVLNMFQGQLAYDPPPQADCTNGSGGFAFGGTLSVNIKVGDTTIGFGSGQVSDTTGVMSTGVLFFPLLEPTVDTPRTLTVEVSDTCGSNGGVATTRYVVKSVGIDVLSAR